LGTLTLIGLGLYDELDISLKGVKVAKKADTVYIELYTSLMRGLSLDRLQKILGRTINVVNRRVLEEENGEILLREAERGSVVLFVPGDPLIATTHVDLRIRAEKRGIKTQVIHAASIISAAIGLLMFYFENLSVEDIFSMLTAGICLIAAVTALKSKTL